MEMGALEPLNDVTHSLSAVWQSLACLKQVMTDTFFPQDPWMYVLTTEIVKYPHAQFNLTGTYFLPLRLSLHTQLLLLFLPVKSVRIRWVRMTDHLKRISVLIYVLHAAFNALKGDASNFTYQSLFTCVGEYCRIYKKMYTTFCGSRSLTVNKIWSCGFRTKWAYQISYSSPMLLLAPSTTPSTISHW